MSDWDESLRIFGELVENMHEADLISEGCYAYLNERSIPDPRMLDDAMADLFRAIKHRQYYRLLERIERGEALIAAEEDPVKRAGYEKFKARLVLELEAEYALLHRGQRQA